MTEQSESESTPTILPPASSIPSLTAVQLEPLLSLLTLLPTQISNQLSQQSSQAISDLPPDARPNSYDGLIDVARFCLEEEPGQDHWNLDLKIHILSIVATQINAKSNSVESKQLGKDSEENRLSQLISLYQQQFPELSYLPPTFDSTDSSKIQDLSTILGPTISALATGDSSKVPTLPTSEITSKSSSEYESEVDRSLEIFWNIAGERASKVSSGELKFPDSKTTTTSTSTTINQESTPTSKKVDPVGQDVPFLSLATFRMLVLSSPVLETFFERDLASSFMLTEAERSETGGAFTWHTAPTAPGAPKLVPGSKEALNSKSSSSNLSNEFSGFGFGSGSGGPGTGNYAYSKDVTPGARGKALGFLGGLLGEEGKMKMNQLVDNVGQRLQTHTVIGPKPSFGNNKTTLDGNKIDTDEIKMKEEDDARRNGGISGLTRWGLGARLADAVRGQSSSQSYPINTNSSSSTTTAATNASRGRPTERISKLQSQAQQEKQSKRNSLRGLDLSNSGPAGAAESLRAAAAAIQERSHFVIDGPNDGDGDEVEEGEVEGEGEGEGGGESL